MSPSMFLQLSCSVKSLAALQTSDLIPFRLLIAPAACILLVLLKVHLTEKFSETCDAVNAFRFTLVLAVKLCQAEVAAASNTGVRQQTKVGEAVFQKSILLGKGLGTVGTFEMKMGGLPVAFEVFRRGEFAATYITNNVRHGFVQSHMAFTAPQGSKHTFAQVTFIKLFLQVIPRQVVVQFFL